MTFLFSTRRADSTDAETLSTIGSATFLESFIEDIPGSDLIKHCHTQHSVETYSEYLTKSDPRYACWIVSYAKTGAPIGYALTCPPDLPVDTADTDIELKRIYVFSRYHGSGAAKALNNLVDEHARSLSCRRILLGTYEDNKRAIAFYHREGYEKVGTRQFQVGDELFDDIIMAKPLSS
ncbi:MAG: GNAT family N-acetyltransferase [Pseudomonadota bacterium]